MKQKMKYLSHNLAQRKGSGIGLTISYKIIKEHGGKFL